jgi:MFS family permease
MSRIQAALRALKHRNYRLFFGGQLISLVGTWMQNVAQAWLVYKLTDSSFLLGLVSFAGQIPIFLLSPVGGAAADRWKRHRIVIGTQTSAMVLAFTLAWLTLGGRVHVWHVIILASLLGVVNAFDIPARQAFVVEMVGKEDLANAIALNSSLFNSARMIGPAVAGVLVASIGEGWCFLVNAISYAAVIIGLLMMKVPPRPKAPRPESAIAHVVEGFRYAGRTRPIRALLLLMAVASISGMPYTVLMPIFADRVLHSGAQGLGILMGASGVGALSGALALAMRRSLTGLGRLVARAAGAFGFCLILFAISRSFWLSVALMIPVGFSVISQMAASNTLIQSMVPDELRGRVMSVYSMMFLGMAPLGALSAGAIASKLGASATLVTGGSVCIVSALIFSARLPLMRHEARQLILAQQVAGGDPPEEAT